MPPSPKTRAFVVTAWAVVAAAATVWLLLDALPPLDRALHAGPVDGCIDWIGARAFWEHVNPFSPEGLIRYNIAQYGFGHPPTAPFWFLPLTRWGVEVMGVVVGYLTLLLLVVHVILLSAELLLPAPVATAMLLFALVASTSWFRDHLHMAQLSEAIAFFYVVAWICLRRERDLVGGALLGLATTFKLFPGLMVVFLLLARRWRAFAAACASWLAVALVMTARYGVACWPQFFRLQGPIGARWIGDLRNASLHGIVLRWFHPVCLRLTGTVPRATAIALVLSLALVAGAWWLTRPLVAAKKIDLPFALFALIATFVNPWSWEHYDVLLLLPWLIAATTLWRGRREQPAWTLAVGGALLAAVVWMLGVDMSIKGRWLHEWLTTHDRRAHLRLHVYEVVNWLPQLVLIALVAALAALQARKSRGSAGRTTGQL